MSNQFNQVIIPGVVNLQSIVASIAIWISPFIIAKGNNSNSEINNVTLAFAAPNKTLKSARCPISPITCDLANTKTWEEIGQSMYQEIKFRRENGGVPRDLFRQSHQSVEGH